MAILRVADTLISEMKGEPDLKLVWDELVRYKWANKSM